MSSQENLSPYTPPKADLGAVGRSPGHEIFFPVGVRKLVVMTTVSFGLYLIFWAYRNWKYVLQQEPGSVRPSIRALFHPLFAYALFTRINAETERRGEAPPLQAGALAVLVFVLNAVYRLPDPWWLCGFLVFLPLIPVQQAINRLNRVHVPSADMNQRFSGSNIVGIVLGSILLVLMVIGLMAPGQE